MNNELVNERVVLTGLIRYSTLFNKFKNILSANSFSTEINKTIYEAIEYRSINYPGMPHDYETILEASHSLGKSHLIVKKENLLYLNALLNNFIHEENIERFVQNLNPNSAVVKPVRQRRAYTIDELGALPKKEWLIEGIIPENSFSFLWGQPGHSKTFLALDWALSIAMGKDWKGHPSKCGSVLYICAEGQMGIVSRCKSWLNYYGIEKTPTNFHIIPESFSMIFPKEIEELEEIIDELGGNWALIVIDTLSRNLGGAESNEVDMGDFIKSCDRLRNKYKCAVLPIHHTGWNLTRERGHSSLRGASDMIIEVKKINAENILEGVEVICTKSKEAEPFNNFALSIIKNNDSLVVGDIFDIKEREIKIKEGEEEKKCRELLYFISDDESDPLTIQEIIADSRMSRHIVQELLLLGKDKGWIKESGAGKKGNPYIYSLTRMGCIAGEILPQARKAETVQF